MFAFSLGRCIKINYLGESKSVLEVAGQIAILLNARHYGVGKTKARFQ
jgi:hypothetical protein